MATKKKPQDKDQDKDAQQSKPEEEESGLIDVGPDFDAPQGKFAFLKNKKVMIGAGAAVLLLVGGGGAAMFMAGGSETTTHEEAAGEDLETAEADEEEEEEEEDSAGEGADGELPLVDVPPMVVNMRSPDGNNRYLKLRFMLEAKSAEKVEQVKSRLPAIIDAYQPFLRELRPEDVSGSAAVFRIKEEMLIRANQVAGKNMVRDVLIQDLIQQ